jgi:hypothetical protein
MSSIRNMWDCYDVPKSDSKALSSLITALKRLVTERPAVLGVRSQMGGIGVQPDASPASSADACRLDMADRVASATVSGVVGMIGSGGGGLSLHGSFMKFQSDSMHNISMQQFALFSGPIYTTIVMQHPRAPGEAVIRAPPAVDLSTLPQNYLQTNQLRVLTNAMFLSRCWSASDQAQFTKSVDPLDEVRSELSKSGSSGRHGLDIPSDSTNHVGTNVVIAARNREGDLFWG